MILIILKYILRFKYLSIVILSRSSEYQLQTEEKLKIKEDIAKNIADSIKVLIDQAGGEVALSSIDSTKKAYHNVSKNLQIPTSGTLLVF